MFLGYRNAVCRKADEHAIDKSSEGARVSV